ncbi:uncharacterized protein LOC116173624 [Photinus pyralis]|uniref:uncharacterized protein LOC116173624 n=1 Tax=Photinus pyralis TaxID=7054 RepID=UPI001266FD83|nr:uncharacterized protein LOC116173624 [Photinus pyralis]
MIKTRIEWWLEGTPALPPRQYGFRRNKGTMEALSDLITEIQTNLSHQYYTGGLFLDIKDAYNHVDLDILEEKMCKIGIPKKAAGIISNLFRNRTIYLKTPNNTLLGPRTIALGLPQGSTLSPILFNVYTHDIHEQFRNKVTVIQYADDICLLAADKELNGVVAKMSTAVSESNKWFLHNGFEVSKEKSSVVLFARQRNIPTGFIRLDNVEYNLRTSIRYLGLIINNKLKWNEHINYLTIKCEKSLNILKVLTKVGWGCDIHTALLMYKSYIRARLDYGCLLYGNAPKSQLKRLDIIQNKALRTCTGAMISTPTLAMQVEANEPPLYIRRQFLAEKYIIKLKTNNLNHIIVKISNLLVLDQTADYWRKKPSPPLTAALLKETPNNLRSPPIPNNFSFLDFMQEIEIIYPPFNGIAQHDRQLFNNITNELSRATLIFADGSKTEKGCGCAFYDSRNSYSAKFQLSKSCSIFTVEAFAILEALKYSVERKIRHAIIFSDSLGVLQAIKAKTSYDKLDPILQEITLQIIHLRKMSSTIQLYWVKGHVGIQHNETADALAKDSVENGRCMTNVLSKSDVVRLIKLNTVYLQWENYWKTAYSIKKTHYSIIHPNLVKEHWYKNMQISRFYYTTIARLKFGHGKYPAHCCVKREANIRNLLEKLSEKGVAFPTNITTLLHSCRKPIYDAIIDYVREIKLKL